MVYIRGRVPVFLETQVLKDFSKHLWLARLCAYARRQVNKADDPHLPMEHF